MWISQENENSQGQAGREAPSQARAQTLDRLKRKFPKSARILKKKDYYILSKSSSRLLGNFIIVDYRLGSAKAARLGITVSRKYGRAHMRNRFKRVVREAYRHCYFEIPSNLEINVSPRMPYCILSKEIVLTDLRLLISKIML